MNLTIFLSGTDGIYVFNLKNNSFTQVFLPYEVIKSGNYSPDQTSVLYNCRLTDLKIIFDDLRPGSDKGLIKMNREYISESIFKMISELKITFSGISAEGDLSSVITGKLTELFNLFPDDRVIYFNRNAVFLIENHSVQKVLIHSPGLFSTLNFRFQPDLVIADEDLSQEISEELKKSGSSAKLKIISDRKTFNGLSEYYVPYLPFISDSHYMDNDKPYFNALRSNFESQSRQRVYIRYAFIFLLVSCFFLYGTYHHLNNAVENRNITEKALSESVSIRTLFPWFKKTGITPSEYADFLTAVTGVNITSVKLSEFADVISVFDSTWINKISYSGGTFGEEGYTVSNENIFRIREKVTDFRISRIRTIRYEDTDFYLFTGEFW